MVSKLLSVIADRWQGSVRERIADHLLRPIFINGVEVGFAHVRPDEENKKLSVRGVTIALWYFISRGHQAQALMPFCFKTYPNKSDNWNELMALFRLNLIEFTPGYGSDKYVEVNRIIAMRAREYGGCMVARSQMQSIVEEQPLLEAIVEKRLLIPSFNGNDLIFPVDGPLGRNGPNLIETLECTTKEPEFPRCALQQMTLQDQRFWLSAISAAASNMAGWTLLAEQIRGYQPKSAIMQSKKSAQNAFGSFQLHPPETNPPENRGFSIPRIRRWGQRHMNYGKCTQTDPIYYNNNYRRSSNSTERSIRYINTNLMMQSEEGSRQSTETKNNMQGDQANGNSVNGERNKRSEDSLRWCVVGNCVKTAINPVQNPDRTSSSTQRSQDTNKTTQNSRYFTSLATVFGWNKAKAICEKHPTINNVCVLAQLLLEEDEQTMADERVQSHRENHQNVSSDTGVGNAESSAMESISEQHHTSIVIDSNQTQTETSPQVHIAASTSNISLDLISFASPVCTPPQANDPGNDTHFCDSCPDLIEL